MGSRVLVLIAFLLVLSVPFLVRGVAGESRQGESVARDARRLVVVTPHVEQIQVEFARAFDRWHRRVHNQPVEIDWRQPGGTSEIVKQLEASFDAAARKGLADDQGKFPPGTGGFDVFFGGGSFEHSKMREVKTATAVKNGAASKVTYRMGQPAGFSKQQLDEWYAENKIGVQNLYDPDQYWMGTALSGFGIVFNRDVLKSLGLPEPTGFDSLCDYRYVGKLALTDGRLSGSVTTTYESILNKEGWEGWKTLRKMAANARYFASAATRPPVDVGQGEAAAGLAIDFYGRGQAQFLTKPGAPESASRVGYIDPKGAVYIDADPASILNGATDVELARRFIEFCLTEEAQALWQFPARAHERAKSNPAGPDGSPMGPEQYELRRMPVRRVMYAKYAEHFIDPSDPFKAASDVPSKGWRSAIGPMMAAFGVDTRPELVRAWRALNQAKARGVSPGTLQELEALLFSMPMHEMRPGTLLAPKSILDPIAKNAKDELSKLKITTFDQLAAQLPSLKASAKTPPDVIAELEKLLASRPAELPTQRLEFNEANFRAIRADTDSWKDPLHGRRSLIAYTQYFRETYAKVAEQAEGAGK